MDVVLTKNHRLVAKAAAPVGDNRKSIQCVHIKDGFIEAADGFILVRKSIIYNGEELSLNAKQIDMLQDPKPKTSVTLKDKGDDVVASSKYGRSLIAKETEKFPDTVQLFPKCQPVFKIALSRNILKKMLSCLDNSDTPLKFYFYGEKEPVKITEGDTTALVMPMFVDWKV